MLPLQPLARDVTGTIRFVPNSLVAYLLADSTAKGVGLNELALIPHTKEEWSQLLQLIGYSVDGLLDVLSGWPHVGDLVRQITQAEEDFSDKPSTLDPMPQAFADAFCNRVHHEKGWAAETFPDEFTIAELLDRHQRNRFRGIEGKNGVACEDCRRRAHDMWVDYQRIRQTLSEPAKT